jgi:putative flippase GtrA
MTFGKYHSVLRFLISGSVAAGTEYAVFLILHGSGLKLVLANVISFCCGLVVSFLLNKHWVFSHKSNGSRQFAAYTTVALINLLISSAILVVLVNKIHIPAFIAKFCVMLLIASWNYVIFKKLIFKNADQLTS